MSISVFIKKTLSDMERLILLKKIEEMLFKFETNFNWSILYKENPAQSETNLKPMSSYAQVYIWITSD